MVNPADRGGTLTFNPGVTSQPISVGIIGSTAVNPNLTFSVNLSSPANATIGAGTGTGTIVSAVVPPAGTPIPTLSDWGVVVLSVLVMLFAFWSVRARRR